MKNPKIVTIGGGTGSFSLLLGLKKITKDISAIISMADDGGSTGKLRDELGVLPPGDIRQALVALSKTPRLVRELFNYRFTEEGSLSGHSFGNLFISAMEKVAGDFAEAVDASGKVLDITGHVVPVTTDDTRLGLRFENGEEVVGEHIIDEMPFERGARPEVFLKPAAKINPQATQAIANADVVIIAPGTLHTSLLPNLAVGGMREALQSRSGRLVYVCNLVTTAGQTDGYSVCDFVDELEKYCGEGSIDTVLYNSEKPTEKQLELYAAEGEFAVELSEACKHNFKLIEGDFISRDIHDGDPKATRSLLRHNGDAIAKAIQEMAL